MITREPCVEELDKDVFKVGWVVPNWNIAKGYELFHIISSWSRSREIQSEDINKLKRFLLRHPFSLGEMPEKEVDKNVIRRGEKIYRLCAGTPTNRISRTKLYFFSEVNLAERRTKAIKDLYEAISDVKSLGWGDKLLVKQIGVEGFERMLELAINEPGYKREGLEGYSYSLTDCESTRCNEFCLRRLEEYGFPLKRKANGMINFEKRVGRVDGD